MEKTLHFIFNKHLSYFVISTAVLLFILIIQGALFPNIARAGLPHDFSGYAWSDNIGWISFNCTNTNSCATSDYGVDVDQNGEMSGYAWRDNIGWVSFNSSDLSGCPSGTCNARLNSGSGIVFGWTKALSADGNGWDGWIQLSGSWSPSVSFSANAASGYSWGSDVVGWVSWSGSGYGVTKNVFTPTASLSASPSTIDTGQSATLSWSSTNATSCTGTGFTAGGATSGSASTGALNTPGTYNYQVVCTGAGGNSPPSFASVEVLSPSVAISANPARVRAGANSQISWSASQVKSCAISGPGLSSSGTSGSQAVPISFQSIFTIACTTNGSPATNSVTVNVVPVFNEF